MAVLVNTKKEKEDEELLSKQQKITGEVQEKEEDLVHSTPHFARVTRANILSRVAQGLNVAASCCLSLRRAISTGAFHVARFMLMA